MGKAAENEKIKLQSAFLNNCGAGALVGGVLIPLFAIYPKLGEWAVGTNSGTLALSRELMILTILPTIAGIAVAIWVGLRLHWIAARLLEKIQD
jgi:hypothetical protein